MKQATVKLPSGTYLIQEVPEVDSMQYFVKGNAFTWDCGIELFEFELPPGSWQLLGADPTALTEEEAGEIVERHSCEFEGETFTGFKHYGEPKEGSVEWKYDTYDWPFDHAAASLDSLAASLQISKPFVVLKNIEK